MIAYQSITNELIMADAVPFTFREEWRRACKGQHPNMALLAKKRGIYEQCCAHMKYYGSEKSYTRPEIKGHAKQFLTPGAWRKADDAGSKEGRPNHFQQAVKFGKDFYNECCAHMTNRRIWRGPLEVVGPHGVYAQYVARARRRNQEFSLSKDAFFSLIKKDCLYCGEKPSNHLTAKIGKKRRHNFLYTGLDRIDSGQGYTPDNVVPSCITCNLFKLAMSQEEFRTHIEKVYNHWAKPSRPEPSVSLVS